MRVIFGGVRGSNPVNGNQYTVYGEDTTSILILGDNGERIVIDAGTGLKNLLPHLGESTDPLVLLLTHYHLDHLMGLPTFDPLYQRGRPIKIVGLVPMAALVESALSFLRTENFSMEQVLEARLFG